MREYLYSLIRHVADRERMEPINVGLILQGPHRLDLRFNPHVAKRDVVDTDAFRKWKVFLETEIRGPAVPLFQPERNSPRFFRYLADLCDGPVALSRPLFLSTGSMHSFDEVLESLYQRLVAPPKKGLPGASPRPAGRFREIAEERRFLNRGMKRHTHVIVGERPLWIAYRQILNGDAIALDKVEVSNQIGKTANEIERLPRIASSLPEFVGRKSRRSKPSRRYFLLADEFSQSFTDQSQKEFELMRGELESAVDEIRRNGGTIIRSASEAEALAAELDDLLPRVASP